MTTATSALEMQEEMEHRRILRLFGDSRRCPLSVHNLCDAAAKGKNTHNDLGKVLMQWGNFFCTGISSHLGAKLREWAVRQAGASFYRIEQNNSCMFEFPAFLILTN